jgi:hypothetical protein
VDDGRGEFVGRARYRSEEENQGTGADDPDYRTVGAIL